MENRPVLEATGLLGDITPPAHPNMGELNWSAPVCHNRTFLDISNLGKSDETREWEPVLDSPQELGREIGVSGTVCSVDLKPAVDPHADVPFLHPFYNDWTFYLALDEQYASLLSTGNEVVDDPHDTAHDPVINAQGMKTQAGYARDFAQQQGISVPLVENRPSFLEVEMEQGLIGNADPFFFPRQGDRVAVFGRWIADCGHNYSTEIHPPLMLVAGRPSTNNLGMTATVIGRAFHVSQTFDDGGLLNHLSKELGKALASGIPTGEIYPIYQMQARPKIISPPFTQIVIMSFIIRPPSPRQSPTDTLNLNFHFTVRSGVSVQVSKGIGHDEVKVTVLMNDVNYPPAPLPPKEDMTVQISDLPWQGETVIAVISGVGSSRGIVTERYHMLPAKSVHDNENVVNIVVDNGIPGNVESAVSVDNSQPYPIYGWLSLYWIQQEDFRSLRTFLHARGVKSVRALQPTGNISVKALIAHADHSKM